MKDLNLVDFTYALPPERIAVYPLKDRDQSKLLVYKHGAITHRSFNTLTDYLPQNTILFFNDTKVIPARLLFRKNTGAEIEIFLLNPVAPSTLLLEAMQAQKKCCWKCTIGNVKRWTEGTILLKEFNQTTLHATLLDREEGIVEFSWSTLQSFAEIIDQSGETPLPPYLKRKAESADRDRYQTIYAHFEGAVAAPTAGLHFTPTVLASLKQKNIQLDFLTLHVSAGTFQPIKVENVADHTMHSEQVIVSRTNLENLLQNKFIVPVGTTSMRTLESVYWFGVKLLRDPSASFNITQHECYTYSGNLPTRNEALKEVMKHMDEHQLEILHGTTSIYIMPGYTFRVCEGLITNFHQPGSTLMLLVAAFVGKDWKTIYQEALANQYRFLSYGDSSLLIPHENVSSS